MNTSSTRFTSDHEWIRKDGELFVIGITDHAQRQLGDVVFVELPETGRVITTGEAIAVVESIKAANDLFAPIDGEIHEINPALEGEPGLVNRDPFGEGWFFKIRSADESQFLALLDEAAYRELTD